MGADYERTGNVLLNDVLGCTLEYRNAGLDMNAEAERTGEALRARGRKPYVIPGGGSNPIGALGYANCATELVWQADSSGLRIDAIVHATGSTGTQAGLVAGLHGINAPIEVMGISVRAPRERQIDNVHALACRTADLIGLRAEVPRELVQVRDDQVGPGYGQPTLPMQEAMLMLARLEGILLDPVYSAKGMAGLIDMVRQGIYRRGQNVVFIHTGGAAALPAYQTLFTNQGAPASG